MTHYPNKKLIPFMPYVVCVLASLFYVYEFFLRITPAALTQELMRDFSMDASTLGFVSAFFFYTYTFMQLPAGLLLDRYGPRMVLSVSMLVCTLAAFLCGSTHALSMLALSRAMVGGASAFAFVGALLLASRWFPLKYFALITGFVQFMGCLGAILSGSPVRLLADHIGWRAVFHGSGIIGAVITLLFWFFLHDHPPQNQPQHTQPQHHLLAHLWGVLKEKQTWIVGFSALASWAPVSGFAALWGVPFLAAAYQTSTATAAAATSSLWIGVAVASPVVGWWSNHIHARRTPLIVTSALALCSCMGVLYWHQPAWWVMHLLLFLLGCSSGAQIVTFGLVQDIHPPKVAATAVGFNNMAVVFSAVVLQPLIGWILHACWPGDMVASVPVYPLSCYQKALTPIAVCCAMGLINALFFIKETHCQPQFK